MNLHFFNLDTLRFEVRNNLGEKIFEFNYFPDKNYFSLTWLGFLYDAEIKSILEYTLGFLQSNNHSITNNLSNHIEMEGGITEESIDWIFHNLLSKAIAGGLKKIAFVNSPDFYTQLAFERFTKKISTTKVKQAYFDDYVQAENWLTQQQVF
jgi:hypothetical protein